MNDSSQLKEKITRSVKVVLKAGFMFLMTALLPIVIIIVILASAVYFLTIDDGTYKEGDWSSVPFAASQNTGSATVSDDGKVTSGYTAKEIWDKNKEEKGRVGLYLDNEEQLAKLMNAEMVTQFLDTRENPDEEIDWEEINKNTDSKDIQGIIKLKRADANGNVKTMTYVDPGTFKDYIERYNKSGDESAKNEALSHFTIEQSDDSDDSNDSENIGIVQGTGKFTKYADLTETQIKQIASLCQQEQGATKGAAAEASLMANKFDVAGKKWGTGGAGLYNYIRNSGWWAHAPVFMDKQNARKEVVEAVRAVLVNGKRTLPKYIDEHDCISDIKSATNKGKAINVNNRSEYKQYVTKLSNVGNSKYTFYCFPTEGSDPFGYTSKKSRKKYGDAYYDFDTGELVNGKDDNTATTDENSKSDNKENDSKTNLSDNTDIWKWPTDGTTISSKYGPRNAPTSGASSDHKGVDISVPEGTNVYACEDGKVTIAMNSQSAGNYIAIDHGNGYVSKYMHNSQLKVKVGDKVKKGDVIALSGNTGISTGAHLHFQIEHDETPVDPMTFKYDNGNGDGSNTNTTSQKNSNNDSSSKYYAKVATWSETTDNVESDDPEVESSSITTYNMTTTNINYQSAVSQYTMPFDYLWALLVIGEDKDFVLQLADLVYGSQIEITVHDNLTITTDTKVDTYTRKTKTNTEGQVTVTYDDQNGTGQKDTQKGNWSDEKEKNYKVTTTNINKDNTLDISLTKANVWIVNYSQEYTYKKPETNKTTNEEKKTDEEYKEKPDKTSEEDEYGHVNELLQDTVNKHTTTTITNSGGTPVSSTTIGSTTTGSTTTGTTQENTAVSTVTEQKIDYIKTENYNKKTNRVINTTNEEETTKYVSSPGKTVRKVDKEAEEDNFVTILLKDECKKAKKNIIEVRSWLFEILDSKDSTKEMIDLTKYLLYKATGKDYGVTEYDFSIYESKNFSDYNETSTNNNDYVVETSKSNSAPVVKDKEKLKSGLKKWLKTNKKQRENALSIIDTVLECQEKDNVNAVFVYAFLRKETGIGSANTGHVNNENNWGSWNVKAGQKFSSPEENVKTITKGLKSGDYYFTKGKNTVGEIGAIYCPNTPDEPTQADDWKKVVNKFMNELYSCMDISVQSSSDSTSVAKGGKGTIGVYTSSTGRKYNLYLQGNPAPWANEDYGDYHSMALAGCGPTAEAIIASSYNANITPSTTRKDIVDKLGTGNHSSATWIGNSLKRLVPGINIKVSNFDENEIKKCIKNSGQVWLVVQHCTYTSGAHCIALIDYRDSNQVYVAHGTANRRKKGWDSLRNIKSYLKTNPILYVGGK